MLPYLQPKKVSGIIMAKAKPEGGVEAVSEEGMGDPAMISIAEDVLSAVALKDAVKLAMALKNACELCAMGPMESLPESGEQP